MLTTVSVVVILGAIIATIARAVLTGDGQPPTADRPGGREPATPGRPAARPESAQPDEQILVPAADLRIEDRRAVPVVLDGSVPWWRRARSLLLLVLMVAALGAIAAAALGVLVVGGASLLDKALG